ncbi:MAG: T9SS type A sorting domain-containing protein [Flavobacteriales bacterium]|nr:T9SS type A sorting domain-containing protein [Flavobacteriales bacterium]
MASDTAFGVVNGCDSITNQQITIDAVDVTVTNSSPMLTANQSGATYRWLDCANGNAAIPGATNQSYTATANGNYAVEVALGSCIDTSACENITGVGIIELNSKTISIYPNPTRGIFTIDLLGAIENTSLTVYDMLGKVVVGKELIETTSQIDLSGNEKGIYFINIQTDNGTIVRKIIIQ